MGRWRRTTACEQAGQWVSLRLDDELSELEQVALDRHLEQCPRCRAIAEELTGVAVLLRAAPLAELERELAVASPRRARTRLIGGAAALTAFASAAAAAVVFILAGTGRSEAPRSALAFRSVEEQIRFVRVEQHRLEPPAQVVEISTLAPRVAARSL